MLAEAAKLASKNVYFALVMDLNCGLRDKELRELQWQRIVRRLKAARPLINRPSKDGRTLVTLVFGTNVVRPFLRAGPTRQQDGAPTRGAAISFNRTRRSP
ncbi:MAG: hypothetical protein NTW28_25925, partial [Candidatus Solibacter sp.]|nr:hypothetical protein [Candidatus Solibacter sp.]